MLDECDIRIASGFVVVLILVGPLYYRMFKKRRDEKSAAEVVRKNEQIARECYKRLLWIDAGEVVDRYIRGAIKEKRPSIQS